MLEVAAHKVWEAVSAYEHPKNLHRSNSHFWYLKLGEQSIYIDDYLHVRSGSTQVLGGS